eukprot:2883003-Rhodomonas_salina.1
MEDWDLIDRLTTQKTCNRLAELPHWEGASSSRFAAVHSYTQRQGCTHTISGAARQQRPSGADASDHNHIGITSSSLTEL